MSLIRFTKKGIYCEQGDFYIDPWRPVDKAVITHAHADHSRYGMKHYLTHTLSAPVMKHRLGNTIDVQTASYGEVIDMNGVKVSLHPAGHIIGSAQVRIEHKGEVWVISGDYKLENDGVCTPFEPVKCDHFLTESTFGLPVFRWQAQADVMQQINEWWKSNAERGVCSVICAYALGKAQRIINHVDQEIGPIFTHGAVENTNEVLRANGAFVAPTTLVSDQFSKKDYSKALVVATPSALGTSWLKRFGTHQTAMASGWMMMRGTRRRRNVDRGFVLSDHADWDELNTAVKASEAQNVYVTHGYANVYSKYLSENGWNAQVVETEFEGDEANAD